MAMAGRVHLLAGLLLLAQHADAQMGGQYGGGGGAGGAGGTSDMKGMLCGMLPIPMICTQGGQGGQGGVQCQNNACCQQSSCYILSMAGCMPSRGATTCEGTTLMNPLQAGKCVCLNGYVCGQQTGQCQQPGIGGVLGNIANGIAGGILGGGGGGNQPAVSGGSGGGGINWGQFTPPPNWGQYTPPPNGWGQYTPPPNGWGQYTPPPSQNGGGGGGNWWDPNQWGNFLNQFTGGGGGGGNQQPNPPPNYPNYPNYPNFNGNGNHFGRLYEVSDVGEPLPPGGVIREDHTLVLSMYLMAFIGTLAFLTLHAVRCARRRLQDRNDGTVREMLVSQESCEEGQLVE